LYGVLGVRQAAPELHVGEVSDDFVAFTMFLASVAFVIVLNAHEHC